MKRMRTATLSLAVLIGVAALAPAAASATLPAPKTAVIKPFKGIGAVRLGINKAAAVGKWGAGNLCASQSSGAQTCSWFASSSTDYPIESGSLQISPGGDVCGILIRAGTNSSSGNLSITGLKKWKTKRGKHKPAVGLGSKISVAKKILGKLVVKKRGVTTAFVAGTKGASRKQVEEITIYEKGCSVT